MADVAAGTAVLFRELGLLTFVQTREGTRFWAVCVIPVTVANGHVWSWQRSWQVVEDGDVLHVSPSVLDHSGYWIPEWHNTAQWDIKFVEGDRLNTSNKLIQDVCKEVNAEEFSDFAYLTYGEAI